ncbi:MAG: hypothetical protein RIC14_01210 [Filomicrobium sp.]
MRISQQAAIYASKIRAETLSGGAILVGPPAIDRATGNVVMCITSQAKSGRFRSGMVVLRSFDDAPSLRKGFMRELGGQVRFFETFVDKMETAVELWPCPETAGWLECAQREAAEGRGDSVELRLEVGK